MEGTITKHTDRGWSLITAVGPENGRLTYFLHINDVRRGIPHLGATVRFDHSQNKKGLTALNAEVLPPERMSHADAAAVLVDSTATGVES